MPPAAIALEGVWKRRGGAGDDRVFELHVPRFHVGRGEFVAVLGASGCGKSTLLDMLGLISRPDAHDRLEVDDDGRVVDAGRADDAGLAAIRRRRLGYVMQTGGLLPFLTVRANARLATGLAGSDRHGAAQRLQAMAGALGIDHLLDRKPAAMSGGQRQRAAVLRALAHAPSLVLADEPTASVDRQTALGMVRMLADLASDAGASVVMVTHDHSLVAGIARRTYGFEVTREDRRTRSVCTEIAGHG